MTLSWLEATGSLALACYLFVMGALMMLIVLRAVLGRPLFGPAFGLHSPTSFGGRASRILLEYVGNTSIGQDVDLPAAASSVDRRRNRQARALLDLIKDRMAQRGFADRDDQQFLADLREAVRQEERMASGERVREALEDSPPR